MEVLSSPCLASVISPCLWAVPATVLTSCPDTPGQATPWAGDGHLGTWASWKVPLERDSSRGQESSGKAGGAGSGNSRGGPRHLMAALPTHPHPGPPLCTSSRARSAGMWTDRHPLQYKAAFCPEPAQSSRWDPQVRPRLCRCGCGGPAPNPAPLGHEAAPSTRDPIGFPCITELLTRP